MHDALIPSEYRDAEIDMIADLDSLRAEVESLDVGEARTEQEAHLFRYVRRRTQLESEVARVKHNTQALLAQLEAKLKGLEYVYGNEVQQLVKGMLKDKARSVRTPFGVAGFRKVGGGLEVTDEDAVVKAWSADLLPDAVIKNVVSKAALNAHFQASGEVPSGCKVKDVEDRFYVQ